MAGKGQQLLAMTSMPRLRQSRADRPDDDFLIPDKLYFRIGEVSRLTETKPYVLRYWETEFPTLRPVKSRSGHRLYRRQDVEMVFRIKRLLYQERFTIGGARQQLAGPASHPGAVNPPSSSSVDGTQLKALKRELQAILTMLSKRC
jgi:DNA-binding transcriptional MerR regulator